MEKLPAKELKKFEGMGSMRIRRGLGQPVICHVTTFVADGYISLARNRFVLENADKLWLPHVTPGGMLDRLVHELHVEEMIK